MSELHYDPAIQVFDGVDWYWLPSMIRAVRFILRQRPQVLIFQWWTGTVLHTYLILALVARITGARIVIEFHEVLDPGEAALPVAATYVRLLAPRLMHMAHGFAVHSAVDQALLAERYALAGRPVIVCPHGPYDHYQSSAATRVYRDAPASSCNLLFFGVIRPYKGLEDLIRAFNAIPSEEIDRYWLTVVGETWEGWTLPEQLIAASPYRDRITLVNRYVRDQEVGAFFAGADAVVLPYHRSSASGPLHIAMSHGLPVIVTQVEALLEVVAAYEGAITVPVQNVAGLSSALRRVEPLRGQRFVSPQSWEGTVESYGKLLEQILEQQKLIAA